MAKAQEQESKESMKSILGKIRSVVSGKGKVTIEDDLPVADDKEPLELTEIVESSADDEETSQNLAENADNHDIYAEDDKKESEQFIDLLQEIDQVLEKQYIEDEAQAALAASQAAAAPVVEEPVNANLAQETPQNEPITVPEVKKEFPQEVSQNIITNQVARNMTENKPNILSEDIANKSSKAIQNLLNNIPRPDIESPAFRSAITLEDIAVEMIRPMLKEWLDKNLEAIVRDIVEKEIKKIIPRD